MISSTVMTDKGPLTGVIDRASGVAIRTKEHLTRYQHWDYYEMILLCFARVLFKGYGGGRWGLIHDQLAVIFSQQRRTHTTLVFYRKHVAFFSDPLYLC